jgi:hypothetical protein
VQEVREQCGGAGDHLRIVRHEFLPDDMHLAATNGVELGQFAPR